VGVDEVLVARVVGGVVLRRADRGEQDAVRQRVVDLEPDAGVVGLDPGLVVVAHGVVVRTDRDAVEQRGRRQVRVVRQQRPCSGVKRVGTSTQQVESVWLKRGESSKSRFSDARQTSLPMKVRPRAPLTLAPVLRLSTLPGKSLTLAARRKPTWSVMSPPYEARTRRSPSLSRARWPRRAAGRRPAW